MRYLILWFGGAVVIFVAAICKTPVGPEFALRIQPLLSPLVSGLVLLLAAGIGLPIRLHGISRAWNGTLLGALTAGVSVVLGWIALTSFFTTPHHATTSDAILGLCGLFGIDFGVLHWPNPRKA